MPQPMLNIVDSLEHSICFTRDRKALTDCLKGISNESLQHLRIVEEFEKNQLRYDAQDWLKKEISAEPKTLCNSIKKLVKKYHNNLEVKGDLLSLLRMERGAV